MRRHIMTCHNDMTYYISYYDISYYETILTTGLQLPAKQHKSSVITTHNLQNVRSQYFQYFDLDILYIFIVRLWCLFKLL